MANSNYNDVFTVTLESRSKALADNVSKNNALLSRLKEKGNLRPISGGSKILEELEYGEGDMVWYSGYDSISYTPKQLFSAAEYALKLCAVPVAVSGEELLMNSGEEQVMDLLEKRIANWWLMTLLPAPWAALTAQPSATNFGAIRLKVQISALQTSKKK